MELNVSELRLGDLGYRHMPCRINFRIEKGYSELVEYYVHPQETFLGLVD